MQVKHIFIPLQLRKYIKEMWVFEISGQIPETDLRLMVPNGLIRMIVPFRNNFSMTNKTGDFKTKDNQIYLIGVCDIPAFINSVNNNPSGMIGVEFYPRGAYRFFNMRQREIKNSTLSLDDLLGQTVKEVEERMTNTPSIEQKVVLFQEFLFALFTKQESDPIFDFCVNKIISSTGSISIKQLEKETGYSSRWLNIKFDEKLGINPKNFCSIIRFHYHYEALLKKPESVFLKKGFYNHYYDQAHFIKDFKRFSGLTPIQLEQAVNEFSKTFYTR